MKTPATKTPKNHRTFYRCYRAFDPYGKMLNRIHDDIEALPTRRLRFLLRASTVLTASNCWWASYRAAKMILPIITAELYRRDHWKPTKWCKRGPWLDRRGRRLP